MKNLLIVLCGGLLAAGISACNEGLGSFKALKSTAQQSKLDSSSALSDFKSRAVLRLEKLKNKMEPTLNLGDGIDNRTGVGMANNCLINAGDPEAIQLSNPHATIDFSRTVSSEQVGNFLHTNVNGNANFGVFSMSANANYTRNSTDTRQSIHFNYLQTMAMDATYRVSGIGNKVLSPDAQNLLEGGINDFTSVCGDSIVQSGKMGALLLVDASFDFASAAAKDSFEASVGTTFTFGSASASMQKVSEQTRKNSKFSVRVLQLGGDPTKLANIFKEKDGNFHILSCSLDNIEDCDNVAKDVIRYAQNDFQTSVDFKKRETLWMYDYATKPWSKLAIKAELPILTDEQIFAREYLTDTITQDRRMLQYLQTYQHQSFYITLVDSVTKDSIVKATSDYQKMVNEYNNYNILDSCYGDTENINTRCIYAANQVRQMRTKYQGSINLAADIATSIALSGTLSWKLVPIVSWQSCNSNNCRSAFVTFDVVSNIFTPYVCYMDTSKDVDYFNIVFPNEADKTLICKAPSLPTYYVKRVKSYNVNEIGLAGTIINDREHDFQSDIRGINIWYFYSDSSDFKYSPI